MYQESAESLSDDLRSSGIDMSVDECKSFISGYFKKYPGVERWINGIKRYANRYKQVKTLTGRTRHLPTIDSSDRKLQGDATRQAVNAPIQSTGSDCTMMALILINKWLKDNDMKTVVCITVHDSIVVDAPKTEVVEVTTKMKDIMENLAKYNSFFSFLGDVPIVSEMEIGYNYAESFEGSISDLEAMGVDGFIQSELAKKKEKEQEIFKKAEEDGISIPRYVSSYWGDR